MEPLNGIPTSQHKKKGQTRTHQPEAEIGQIYQEIHSLIPSMCHQGIVQLGNQWQVPNPVIKECHKTKSGGVHRNFPDPSHQLRQTQQLGPYLDPGSTDQD